MRQLAGGAPLTFTYADGVVTVRVPAAVRAKTADVARVALR